MDYLTQEMYLLNKNVRLVRVSDPWGYAVESLMPDRSKVRRQTKQDTGVYAAGGWWTFASGRVCSSDVPV